MNRALAVLLGQCYAARVGRPSHFTDADLLDTLRANPALADDARAYRAGLTREVLNRDAVSAIYAAVLDTVLPQI